MGPPQSFRKETFILIHAQLIEQTYLPDHKAAQ